MLAVPVISSNGTALPDEFDLVSVEVVREVNRIPYAQLLLTDGEIATAEFPALDSAALAPGAEIEVKVRLGDEVTPLFKGLVSRVRLEFADGGPRLAVECKDKAFRLTSTRRSRIFVDGTDADAIGAILRGAQVDAGDLGAGDAQPALVQYDATDWDFIVSRAEACGHVVVVTDGTLSLMLLDVSGEPTKSFQLNVDDIEDFELELNAGAQLPDVSAVAWDLPQGQATEAATADALALAQGDIDPADTGRALGVPDAVLNHFVPMSAGELKAWATGRLAQNRLAMLQGRLAIGGTGGIALMDVIELNGFGSRFSGNALVSALRHTVEHGNWGCDLRLGLSGETFTDNNDIAAAPAQGLLPGARGLSIGLVAGYADDPEGEYRVQVILPGMSSGEDMLWARLTTPEAGHERGFFFRPDPGDEVIVGFLADDPRQPVVLGALFGSKNRPPPPFADLSDKNIAKGMLTAHGLAIELTDQDRPIMTFKTPEATIALDDDAGEIKLSDGNSNSIVLSKDGVVIKSGKDLKLEASGKVVIKGATIDAN